MLKTHPQCNIAECQGEGCYSKFSNMNFSLDHCKATIPWLPDTYNVFLIGFLSVRDFSIILIAISKPSQANSLPFLCAPELIFELLEPFINIWIQFVIHINIFTHPSFGMSLSVIAAQYFHQELQESF